jgi:hypothetical protein
VFTNRVHIINMNIELENIVDTALGNLKNINNIEGEWSATEDDNIHGRITLEINSKDISFDAIIKNELRNHQVSIIDTIYTRNNKVLLISEHIYPNIKNILRSKGICYLESNGNIFIKHKNIYLLIDTQNPVRSSKKSKNKAFTKTGLRVIFNLLLDDESVNLTYREIADRTNVALGLITNVINGLKDKGFVIQIDRKNRKITNKHDLLQQWVSRYEDILKHSIFIGKYRFVDKKHSDSWDSLELNEKETQWGGESAAALLTKQLSPEIHTLYTSETNDNLIKNYRLVPDTNGNIMVYERFWDTKTDGLIVPVILIYADMINSDDSRNFEIGKLIYDEYIKDKFSSHSYMS